ncbi:M48 family metalloprotease [Sabulicella rubraurantiaca]|uniref:M48 family metalloprotease n=1 Tax=Sabulicella rubraurantiaca TaxID=2811429 RepID=UPI001A96FB7C|nr:M48 family metalloprotease [Sabulicella rubraurantiaca]
MRLVGPSGRRQGAIQRLDRLVLARQRRLNQLQSALLIFGLVLLASLTGFVVAGPEGLVYAACLAGLFLLFDPLVPGDLLFRHAFGAIRLTSEQAPEVYQGLAELTRRADLMTLPTLYLIPSRMLQAMAAGTRQEPVIAVTSGLLRALPSRELGAVLAHEIAHIHHGDVAVMRLAIAAASLTKAMVWVGLLMLALWAPKALSMGLVPPVEAILLLLGAPLAGDLMSLSLSRQREFLADAGAVELTGDPLGLAAALTRLHRLQGDDWERLATRGAGWVRLLRTHPSFGERVRRLRQAAVVAEPVWPHWKWSDDMPLRLARLSCRYPAQALIRRWLL